MNKIRVESPQAKRTLHGAVKCDERRGQEASLSTHLLLNEITGGLFFPFMLL